uniref:LisH domain-containing protein n=1 Tax=Trichuris muris TaxID=70415 RepID=A0A5S6QCH7_TRIMR
MDGVSRMNTSADKRVAEMLHTYFAENGFGETAYRFPREFWNLTWATSGSELNVNTFDISAPIKDISPNALKIVLACGLAYYAVEESDRPRINNWEEALRDISYDMSLFHIWKTPDNRGSCLSRYKSFKCTWNSLEEDGRKREAQVKEGQKQSAKHRRIGGDHAEIGEGDREVAESEMSKLESETNDWLDEEELEILEDFELEEEEDDDEDEEDEEEDGDADDEEEDDAVDEGDYDGDEEREDVADEVEVEEEEELTEEEEQEEEEEGEEEEEEGEEDDEEEEEDVEMENENENEEEQEEEGKRNDKEV